MSFNGLRDGVLAPSIHSIAMSPVSRRFKPLCIRLHILFYTSKVSRNDSVTYSNESSWSPESYYKEELAKAWFVLGITVSLKLPNT